MKKMSEKNMNDLRAARRSIQKAIKDAYDSGDQIVYTDTDGIIVKETDD